MRILIGTNLLTSVDANVYSNHTAFYYHLGKLEIERGWKFIQMAPTRLSIDRMRNEAAKQALLQECDYLVFIDDDMLLYPQVLDSLIEADKDIVMARTFIRGYPFHEMAFIRENREADIRDTNLIHYDTLMDEVDENGLCECDAIGFATVAIKTHLLKKLSPPYFITGPYQTEDVYFCLRCKMELNEPVGIYVDTKFPTAHKMESAEFVNPDNVEKLKEYFKSFMPPEKDKREDRGAEYHELISKVS